MESKITGRIKHLDGLRGWGSVIVLLHHLLLFLPQMGGWYGRFMTDGPCAVFVFFVVSGFAVSAGHLQVNHERLAASMVGRYFRLGIPVAVVSVMAYVLMLTGSMHNVACHAGGLLDELYQFEPSLPGVLKFVSFDVFFGYHPEASYDCVLWTMSYELIGSYILYVFLALFRTKDGPYVVPLLAAVVITNILSRRIGCFWFGYLLAELYLRKEGFAASTFIQHHGKKLQAGCLIGFVAAIAVITWIPHDDNALRLILAVILVTTVTFHPWLSACFQHPISLYLGRISFPLYLVHILVICSWSSYGYLHLPTYGLGHASVIAIIVSSTILISFALAHALLPLETFATRSSSWIGKQSCRLVWK